MFKFSFKLVLIFTPLMIINISSCSKDEPIDQFISSTKLKSITYEGNDYASFEYDPEGHVSVINNEYEPIFKFKYNPLFIEYAYWNIISQKISANGYLESITMGEDGQEYTVSFTYDKLNHLNSITYLIDGKVFRGSVKWEKDVLIGVEFDNSDHAMPGIYNSELKYDKKTKNPNLQWTTSLSQLFGTDGVSYLVLAGVVGIAPSYLPDDISIKNIGKESVYVSTAMSYSFTNNLLIQESGIETFHYGIGDSSRETVFNYNY